MEPELERVWMRLRCAIGDARDNERVALLVGDVRAAIKAIEDLQEAEDRIEGLEGPGAYDAGYDAGYADGQADRAA